MQNTTALKQSMVYGLEDRLPASVQIHVLIPLREISRVPAFLSHHSRRMNTFQQNLSLDVTKVPWICRKNSTILSETLKSLKEGKWKQAWEPTQLTWKAGKARTCAQAAVDVLTVSSGATEAHMLWL